MADIKNYLPERLKRGDQKLNQALIKAINDGGEQLVQQIQACIDQFFLSTANGKYLVQLGEESGFTMPSNSGLDIRAYRVLVPLMVSSPKQVRKTFEEVIEAFYGSAVTKPSVTSEIYEPFSLVDGDDIRFTTEKGEVIIALLSTSVSDITKVSASELAAAINSSQDIVYADTIADRLTGKRFLRVSSTTAGLSGFIRVSGGTAQNRLRFPNIITCDQNIGTVWNITKTQAYSDVMKIRWNGAGVNPNLYRVQKGDVLTIRGTINDAVNGSYVILDSGYDYVTVRNSSLYATSTAITQTSDDQFTFTSQVGLTIYDNDEYGLASETEAGTATITVPAIPPLARRFLSGSSHLHGTQMDVLAFNRNSITLKVPTGTDKPMGINQFVLRTKRMMYDFRQAFYKTDAVDPSTTTPIYSVVSSTEDYSVLPFTDPFLIGETTIHCEVGSDKLYLNFPFPHGLRIGWGFTISDAIPVANLTNELLNREFVVEDVTSPNNIVCRVLDNSLTNIGNSVKFSGVQFGTFNVYRYTTLQEDGSDFYLEFPTETDLINSGLILGQTFRIKADSGTDVEFFYADQMKHRILQVQSFDGNRVNVLTGLGAGYPSLITSSAIGERSADFGGNSARYMLDLTSDWNKDNVLNEMRACMLAYTPSSNAAYVGSFIYDPNGVNTTLTVSKYITHTSQGILRGSNDGVIFIDKASNVFNDESFPQSGRLILDYGKGGVEGPISYLAVIDGGDTATSQIILDPAYRFLKTHETGAQVQFVHELAPYTPTVDGSDYPVYITGTAQARNTLFKLMESLVASGVFLEPDVQLPQLRYQDPAIPPFL